MPSDADLIRRVQGGDTEAYADLVRRHQTMLLTYAAYTLGDQALVDEVVQQAFVSAYEQLGDFRQTSDFATWLRVICRYAILTALKRQSRELRRHASIDQEFEAVVARAAAEDPAEPGETDPLAALQLCMEQLPQTAADLVRRRYVDGLSPVEIADALGRNAGWAATTLHRIRARLRACIEERLGAA